MSSEGTPIVTESRSCFRFLPSSPLGIPISDLPDLRSGFDLEGESRAISDHEGSNRPHAMHCLLKRTWDNCGTNVYESDLFDFEDLHRLEPGSIPAASTTFSSAS